MFKVTDYAAVMMIQAKICDFWPTDSCTSCLKSWAGREGDRGSGTPLENHKNIGFFSNTGPEPLKETSQHSMLDHHGVSLAGR